MSLPKTMFSQKGVCMMNEQNKRNKQEDFLGHEVAEVIPQEPCESTFNHLYLDFISTDLDKFWPNGRQNSQLKDDVKRAEKAWHDAIGVPSIQSKNDVKAIAKEALLPSVDELKSVDEKNLQEIRAYERGEKRKIGRLIVKQAFVVKAYSEVSPESILTFISMNEISRYDKTQLEDIKAEVKRTGRRKAYPKMCDWHGLNVAEIMLKGKECWPTDQESRQQHIKKTHEKVDEAMKLFGTCQFGKEVAEWCKQAPYPGCNLQCIEHSANITRLDTLETVSEKTTKQCKKYEICHSEMPFLHQPCRLADGKQETLDDCKDFLRRKLFELSVRSELVNEYLTRIDAAIKSKNN